MPRSKKMKTYAVYWRNPKTRAFEKLPGASVVTIGGKPTYIETEWTAIGNLVRLG